MVARKACLWKPCSRLFRRLPDEAFYRFRARMYCGQACATAAQRERNAGRRSTRPCGACGKPVTRPQSLNSAREVFCNDGCRAEARAQRRAVAAS